METFAHACNQKNYYIHIYCPAKKAAVALKYDFQYPFSIEAFPDKLASLTINRLNSLHLVVLLLLDRDIWSLQCCI